MFSTVRLLAALAAIHWVVSMPAPDAASLAELAQRNQYDGYECDPTPEHTCNIIFSASLGAFGGGISWPTTSFGGNSVNVYGAACDRIVAAKKEHKSDESDNSGWIDTTYGSRVYWGVGAWDVGAIQQATYQYNGNSYDQSTCRNVGKDKSKGISVNRLQCTFPC
jgi:hypothetical protein